jgi:hypothetical protein
VTFPTAFSSNGIDATTGDYLPPAGSIADFAAGAADWAPAGADASELRARRHRTTERFYAPVHGVDVRDIAQAGWAVVFAEEADPAVRDAMQPVLQQRRQLAGARYRELAGTTGYRAGETKQAFLRRLGIGSSPVDPDVLPYYLLLVGPPDEIPFEVQYQLGVQYAVGRLAFDDVERLPALRRQCGHGRVRGAGAASTSRGPAVHPSSFISTTMSCAQSLSPVSRARSPGRSACATSPRPDPAPAAEHPLHGVPGVRRPLPDRERFPRWPRPGGGRPPRPRRGSPPRGPPGRRPDTGAHGAAGGGTTAAVRVSGPTASCGVIGGTGWSTGDSAAAVTTTAATARTVAAPAIRGDSGRARRCAPARRPRRDGAAASIVATSAAAGRSPGSSAVIARSAVSRANGRPVGMPVAGAAARSPTPPAPRGTPAAR